ncbi:hypothetical protein [uncultured Roseibium sp.]|uniref:hypothetical protein n=1 Tax=uncultured Roseibium sp. TaxID=1936171 RepID=UPI0026205D21|nr:hypothetical protein [uncultured Roseibium sp.]
MIGLLGTIFQSRAACSVLAVAAAIGGLFVWHTVDKSSAVRRAVAEYVADMELTAAKAQLDELQRRETVADQARHRLQSEIDLAQAEALAATQELETYVSSVGDGCTVQSDLLDRLRNR